MGVSKNKSSIILQDFSLITANYGVPKSEQGKTERFRRNLRKRSINKAYEAAKAILGEKMINYFQKRHFLYTMNT